jgi:hypothetical protein
MFPYTVCFFFYEFFSLFFQNSLCRFCFVVFFIKTLWIVTMFLHMVFVLIQCFPTLFFQNYLCRFFFNIELVGNSTLTFPACFFSFFLPKLSSSFFFHFSVFFFFKIVFVDFFSLKTLWIATVLRHTVFFSFFYDSFCFFP